jgi:beta-barrel assembly-enhancing protease
LLDVVLGQNQGLLTEMATNLVNLKNSRGDESEADEYSVIYLCSTAYHAAGAAGFFEKISEEPSGYTPEFLSTHPNPDNRVLEINKKKDEEGCTGVEKNGQYQAILASLP